MNIILVGSTGYLGNKLFSKMINNDYNILCICHNNINIKSKNNIFIKDKDFHNKIIDFKSDIIIYTSCTYEKNNNYNEIIKTNLLFPLELLDTVKPNRFIYIGTSLNKYTNLYSLSKSQMAEYGKYYHDIYGINFYNILLENFYGEDEPDNRLIKSLINKLKNNEEINLTKGEQQRDFIYIDDAVNAIIKIIKSNIKGYYDIPVGSGNSISIRDLVEYLKLELKSSSKLNFGAIEYRKNEHSGHANMHFMNNLGFFIDNDIKLSIKNMLKNSQISNLNIK